MLAGLLAVGLTGCNAEPSEVSFRDVLDAVVRLLRKHYFDQSHLSRLNVAAAEAKLAGVREQWQLYAQVLKPLLWQLGSSHVSASPPRPRGSISPVVDLRVIQHAVGLRLANIPHAFQVTAVRRGTPAFEAGVAPGWTVGHVFTQRTAPDTYAVDMELRPPGEVRRRVIWTVKVDRTPPPVLIRELPGGIALVSFEQFFAPQVDEVLAALRAAESRLIILDLRANGGGQVLQLRRLARLLLPPAVSLGILQTARGARTLRTPNFGEQVSGPLAVLIGPASASAAEVLACSLRDHGRARLFGERTAGTVLKSRRFRLPDRGRMMIPVADYRSARGVRLEGVGVEPDVRVAETREAIAAGQDLVVNAAAAWLLGA